MNQLTSVLTSESVAKILSTSNQTRVVEQHIPMVLYIILYKMVLTFEAGNKIQSIAIQIKANEKHFLIRF